MKWIYGELRNVLDHPVGSYKINPDFIMAVDLNKRQLVIKDFEHPLYYTKDEEELIHELVGDEDD